jgi:hypothetical protein
MVSVLASDVVDRGQRSDQIKDCRIGIFCFFTKHIALRSRSRDWLAQNQDNVSELSRILDYSKFCNDSVNFHIARFNCVSCSQIIKNVTAISTIGFLFLNMLLRRTNLVNINSVRKNIGFHRTDCPV